MVCIRVHALPLRVSGSDERLTHIWKVVLAHTFWKFRSKVLES
jgi:hypothetical protein